jgi:hypothetical protein
MLFAIPLFAARRAGSVLPAASAALKIAAMAGLLTTVLYVALSIFPIIDVPSWLSFAVKISGVVIGLNLLGALVYATGRGRVATATARIEP